MTHRHPLRRVPTAMFLAVAMALAMIVSLAAVVLLPAPKARAVGKVICMPEVGRSHHDPIVNRKMEPQAHQHIFFGNAAFFDRANPNYRPFKDRVGQPTTCQNPDDSAVYWIPDLVYTSGPNEGESVPLRKFFAYYRTWDSFNSGPPGSTIAHHPNTRLVAGNPSQPADQPLDTMHFNWTCDERSSRPGPYQSITDANCAAADGPMTPNGEAVYLTAHIDFPTCWNGVRPNHSYDEVGDTRDNADFRYTNGTRNSASCPPGFGEKVSELRLAIKWDYRGSGDNVALTSDLRQWRRGNRVDRGHTLHGDFWNTWVQTGGAQGGYQRMVDDCVLANIRNQTRCG